MEVRPGLDPARAQIRRAVREALAGHDGPLIVGVSGGADSLALAAALAFEAPKAQREVTAVVVDHGLQAGSAEVAEHAAAQVRAWGPDAVVTRADVDSDSPLGLEAAARDARRRALVAAARARGARDIYLAHTLDDQAETVLLGLARGAGGTSLAGMAPVRDDGEGSDGIRWVRPLLTIRRRQTLDACAAEGVTPWHDPHNDDPRFARVRVRHTVLPTLERELGPGIAEALARTAEQSREDAEAFDAMIDETIEDIVDHAEAGISVSVAALAANPAALRNRIIRHVVAAEFGASLTRSHTLDVARLVTDWRGQGPIDLPGCRASRVGSRLVFTADGSPAKP